MIVSSTLSGYRRTKGAAVIRLLLIGDSWEMHDNVAAFLAKQSDVQLVGELEFDGAAAERAAELKPRVVVIDTDYMVSQILPIVAELATRHVGCSILILVDPSKRGMLPPRRRHRGASFLAKDSSVELLLDTIRRLANGERVVQPRLQVALLGADKEMDTRELEVLALAADGAPVAEIGQRLFLAATTVRNYLSAVIAKTGARNLLDAIRITRNDGWLR
jgi:two-component system response regulator DesR